MNNMNIPNLFGENNFNNQESVLNKISEIQYKQKSKKVKIMGTLSCLTLILSIGLFLYQNEIDNKNNYKQQITNDFLIKNHYNYPIIEKNDIQIINNISQLNKQYLNLNNKIDLLNNEFINLNKALLNTNEHISDMDKIRIINLNHIQKLIKAHQIHDSDLQNLFKLGQSENPSINKIYMLLQNNKKEILEISNIHQLRNQEIKNAIEHLKTINSHSNLYYWLAILCIISSFTIGGIAIWLLINNEKEKIAHEELNLMQENLNITSLINTLMEMDINNITKIQESESITGPLINAINNLLSQIVNKSNHTEMVIKDLQNLKNQFVLTSNNLPTVNINNDILTIHEELNEILNTEDLQLNNIKNDIQNQINSLLQIKFTHIDLSELLIDIHELNEIDQDLSVMIQNLEIFSENLNSNQFNNNFAIGIMQDRLPKLISKKIELNQKLKNAIVDKNNLLNNNNQMFMNVKQNLNELITTIDITNPNSFDKNKIVLIKDKLSNIEKHYDLLRLNLKNQEDLIVQVLK